MGKAWVEGWGALAFGRKAMEDAGKFCRDN